MRRLNGCFSVKKRLLRYCAAGKQVHLHNGGAGPVQGRYELYKPYISVLYLCFIYYI